ncbi:MAG: hypothetical protein EBU33_09560 [Sphingobacteriia bacterium]|nr:hypothetical protein [Sphingobacteriia bacterium]
MNIFQKPNPMRGMKRHAEQTYRGYLYRGIFIHKSDWTGWEATLPNGKHEHWDEMESMRRIIDGYFEDITYIL